MWRHLEAGGAKINSIKCNNEVVYVYVTRAFEILPSQMCTLLVLVSTGHSQ